MFDVKQIKWNLFVTNITSCDRPVIDQNLYYVGMKYTTATFTAAMCNILPAITFLLAWAMRYYYTLKSKHIYMFIGFSMVWKSVSSLLTVF